WSSIAPCRPPSRVTTARDSPRLTGWCSAMCPEPLLDAHDRACWDRLMIQARMHARSREHQRLVDAAKRIASRALERSERPAVYWSAGKDSTALSALVLDLDPSVSLVSEKDDLDYPGEEAYVTELAARWGARLEILRPEISPAEWIEEHREE